MRSLFGEFGVDYLFRDTHDATKRGLHFVEVFRLVATAAIAIGAAHLDSPNDFILWNRGSVVQGK
jgi:hypothetical protein